MTKRIEITKKDFTAAKSYFNAIHVYTEGKFTVNQHYNTVRPLAPIEEWVDRETGKVTYKQVI